MSNRPTDRPQEDFAPGPSFIEEQATAQEGAELPSWLQSFAESVSDEPAPSAAPPRPAFELAPSEAQADPSLPGWLEDEPADPFAGVAAPAGETVGFFSDDDLPAWLRSLPQDGTGDGVPGTAEPVTAQHDVATLVVPPVSRVWLTSRDQPPAPAGAQLFAAIATTADERGDVLLDESPSLPPPVPSAAAMPAPVVQPIDRTADGRWSRTRLWLLTAVIVMSAIMFVLLYFMQNAN